LLFKSYIIYISTSNPQHYILMYCLLYKALLI